MLGDKVKEEGLYFCQAHRIPILAIEVSATSRSLLLANIRTDLMSRMLFGKKQGRPSRTMGTDTPTSHLGVEMLSKSMLTLAKCYFVRDSVNRAPF